MKTLPGYQIQDALDVSQDKIIYRGIKKSTQLPVIIKTLKTDYPTLEQITRLKHEYKITANLNLEGVIKAYSLEKTDNSFALILEDIGGQSLTQLLETRNLNLAEFLLIAIQIAQILGELHQNEIIHKDLKPANIIIEPLSGKVKITDFSIASSLSRENPQLHNQGILEGTLGYMSPEQTGRMNRSIDYRSDFYSLGITYYEMLTGKLPFEQSDPLELIHSHIAITPAPPHHLNPDVPQALSAIVMKLLAKNAEDRYQSAWGLKADLEFCQEQLPKNPLFRLGNQQNFVPGKLDYSSQLLIPQKLYGRESEVATLLAAFDRIAQKNRAEKSTPDDPTPYIPYQVTREILLVSGYSGIGKTSVINEIHKPIVRQRGYFITGKFDQLQRNIPYAALIQAFQSLIQKLLTEPQQIINTWREKLLTRLGDNAQVIIDVIPEVELIIGPQPDVPQLSATAAQNRFNRIFPEFIQTFAQPEHPLVIFLDDLQWADTASLQLIELLMSASQCQNLLVIGAYRDNEVSAVHPLIEMLEHLYRGDTVINHLVLQPLTIEAASQLIADALHDHHGRSQPLAELLFHKTGGNPFFLTQLLQTLYTEHLLTFNFTKGTWQWDIPQIQSLGITDYNVVELVARNLQKLPPFTQQVLKLAACIGNRFDLNILAIINQKSPSDTATDLWAALQTGLILPLSDSYKIPLLFDLETSANQGSEIANSAQITITYKFLHDRVQQAAYSLIPDAFKQQTHHQIGQLLLQHTPQAQREEHIFDIVNQLNIATELISHPQQREELAQLNLMAGKKAKAATAYDAAQEYLNLGLELLPISSWQSHYELTFSLHTEALETEYIKTNFSRAAELSQLVLAQANTLLDKIKVYELQIPFYFTQNKMAEAIEMGLAVLSMLQVKLSPKPNKIDIMVGLLQTKLVQGRKRIEDLGNLPLMSDPNKLAAMRILKAVVPASYVARPQLYPLLIFKMVNLSLQYGNCSISCFAYSSLGLIHCAVLGDMDKGYRYGQLGLNLLEKLQIKETKSLVAMLFNVFVRHWKDPIRATREPLQRALQSGLESGDVENACHCAAFYCTYLFLSGEPLETVSQKQSQYIEFIDKYKQEFQLHQAKLWHQVVLNLQATDEVNNPWQLAGEFFDEQRTLPVLIEAKNDLAIFMTYLAKSLLSYWFCDYAQSWANASLASKYRETALGTAFIPIYNFYFSLTLLALYPGASKREQQAYLKQIEQEQKQLQHWAKHAPDNYAHKYDLVVAEKAKVLGQHQQAAEYYDKAIRGAKNAHYLQEEALAAELAAEFFFSRGRDKMAQAYLTDAYYGYMSWGALAKVEDLKLRYAQFFDQLEVRETQEIDVTTTRMTILTLSRGGSAELALDLATVMKATQAISGEIVLEHLLERLMQILMESAGAQRGLLVLNSQKNDQHQEGWILAAEATVEPEQKVVLPFVSLAQYQDLPISVVNYVQRTTETVVLNQALTEGLFTNDPYVVKYQPQSLLSLPIIYQGKLTSILYLENRSTPGAFTHKHLELLSLLSTQSAIALENALLYASLEEKVAIRTQELEEKNLRLEQTLNQLQQTQLQLIQSEKMSSLGQLVAGVAHEINNPVNFIYGNVKHVQGYSQDLLTLIELYQQHLPNHPPEIEDFLEELEWEFLSEDLPRILDSMKTGANRIRQIVQSLRNFSRLDESELKAVNVHEGIDNTLLLLQHRLRAKPGYRDIEVIKDYNLLPEVQCYASELNQVFMHILTNAIDALEEVIKREQENMNGEEPSFEPKITIHTAMQGDEQILIEIADNGVGMDADTCKRIFDPFFTTKPVGSGTGMGMAISYQIIVDKHGGKLDCTSTLGKGTQLTLQVPLKIKQSKSIAVSCQL